SFGPALPVCFVHKINPATGSIMYSTLVAGTTGVSVAGIAVDSQGAAYITGATFSTDFPTTASAFQAGFAPNATQSVYVVKLEPSGSSISFSTLLGGNGIQAATAIAVDRWGAAYITGTTNSTDFPTTTGAFQTGRGSAFVSKFNADGSSLDYSTLFGGNGPDSPAGLAVDDRGSAYITGSAFSQDFPTTTGAFLTAKASPAGVDNPFVMKLNPAGSALVYSTFLGGSDGSHNRSNAIAVGADGSAVGAGTTNSPDFTMGNALFNCPRGGNLLKTIGGGGNFSRSENGLPASGLSALAIDPGKRPAIYAAFGGESPGLFKSLNSGRQWVQVSDFGQKTTCSVLVLDPVHTSTLYAGISRLGESGPAGGVLKSIDPGRPWAD